MGVEGIILAAGLSSRAKTYKMTLILNGRTIIENTIEGMLPFCERIILVGGYKIEMLEPIAKRYDRVLLVFNENYKDGMFSSVKKGIGLVKEERFFFTPGDYPLISQDVYRELLKHDDKIVIPTFQGRKGHPVFFNGSVKDEILEEGRYLSLRDYIGNSEPVFVPVDCRGILMDVDTMEDYENILSWCIKGVK
ncbi:nucleotidyltransferase family protein [Fonticella tunisiensis]|uniref:Molybdenum cofactor cytidylyltransferase n=1 Tax=Fonticella tunisiensis TaxID=1096341 RepID=A0A4V3ETS7_9CLOT|nr:nucleotidyltransferase family protein [Fonticella tunisiensis]TDT63665.1 molybdenum cofactor cytidylyltransferase [Fonticella tunisiensis]